MPSPELVQRALEAIRKRPANYEYFFDRLNSPDWIEPLVRAGFFRTPPDPIRRGDFISFPSWPESRYLARVATKAPKLVLPVAISIPNTPNVNIYEDLLDAASVMPRPQASALASKITDWISTQDHLYMLLPAKAGVLLEHLLDVGETKEALRLAQATLSILPAPASGDGTGEDGTSATATARGPRTRLPQWEYERFLTQHVPRLATVCSRKTVHVLLDLLRDALKGTDGRGQATRAHDYSFMWRPAIEEHEQNRIKDIRSLLVAALRDAAFQVASSDAVRRRELIQQIEAQPQSVLQRLGLHLRRSFASEDFEFAAEAALDRAAFNNIALRHEYSLLLRDVFPYLAPEQQQTILNWVEEGPDLTRLRDSLHAQEGREATAAEERTFADRWRRDRLASIAERLPEPWATRYRSLVAELGQVEQPEFVTYTSAVFTGPTAPLDEVALSGMKTAELLAFLQSWTPSNEFMGPSPEGLARQIGRVVAADPVRFAEGAPDFGGLDPTYARALLDGLREAVKAGQSFAWEPVLELSQRIVDQPRSAVDTEHPYEDRDPHWGWARSSVAQLLQAGFDQGPTSIPFALRPRVWTVLEPITDDPDPTPESEQQFGGSNMDPSTLSLNATRGEAMHAAVHYGLWVRRGLSPVAQQAGLRQIPELRAVLDRHLDLTADPSLAVQSVYGWWFPWLVLLDRDWAGANVDRIFPHEEHLRGYWEAAWEAYLASTNAYDEVFDLLSAEYERAIERIGSHSGDLRHLIDPDARLAEHLMVFYWRGVLELDGAESVLGQFYGRAPDKVRSHAMVFVGENVGHEGQDVPLDVLDRLRALWDQRRQRVSAAGESVSFAEELAAWGWWFASGRFPADWSLDQLQWVLATVKRVEPVHLVLQHLARLVTMQPTAVLRCLRLMYEGAAEPWRVHVADEETRTILSSTLSHQDPAIRSTARELVDYLGARGNRQIRSLVDNP